MVRNFFFIHNNSWHSIQKGNILRKFYDFGTRREMIKRKVHSLFVRETFMIIVLFYKLDILCKTRGLSLRAGGSSNFFTSRLLMKDFEGYMV